ncbi:MAG: hypothetical protein AB8I80_11350 [Anaerolineae bacterium]
MTKKVLLTLDDSDYAALVAAAAADDRPVATMARRLVLAGLDGRTKPHPEPRRQSPSPRSSSSVCERRGRHYWEGDVCRDCGMRAQDDPTYAA